MRISAPWVAPLAARLRLRLEMSALYAYGQLGAPRAAAGACSELTGGTAASSAVLSSAGLARRAFRSRPQLERHVRDALVPLRERCAGPPEWAHAARWVVRAARQPHPVSMPMCAHASGGLSKEQRSHASSPPLPLKPSAGGAVSGCASRITDAGPRCRPLACPLR